MSETTGQKHIDARLENWFTQEITRYATESCVIFGYIFDDKKGRFKDDTWISTSFINKTEFKEGEVVETMNSRYLLGKRLNFTD